MPEEAMKFGLVNKIYDTQAEMIKEVMLIAKEIASKGPLAITSTKEMLNFSRDHSIEESLNYVALWNNKKWLIGIVFLHQIPADLAVLDYGISKND